MCDQVQQKVKYSPSHTRCRDFGNNLIGTDCYLYGWIRDVRDQAGRTFLGIYDGSNVRGIQVMTENPEQIESLKGITVGASIQLYVSVIQHPEKKESYDVIIKTVINVNRVEDPMTFPLAGKPSLELLRDHQEIRGMSRTIGASMTIRSALYYATTEFFKSKGTKMLNPNTITKNDCEGAGETFTLTKLMNNKISDIPTLDDKIQIDYSKDFFKMRVSMTVSAQLQLEGLLRGAGPVLCILPSFRAEDSHTNRHLAEFTHVEGEFPWMNLKDLIDIEEEYTQYCFERVLEECMDELELLDKFTSKGLIEKLKGFVSKPYQRITYNQAVEIITEHSAEIKKMYKLKELPKWGDDLGSQCEKYICEIHFKSPTFVFNYPKTLKSFYMKQNEDNKTVQACDLLIPSLGELIGSSVREDDYKKLMKTVEDKKIDPKPLKWYLDLRKNGSTPTAGFGLGFDRLVSVCTGLHIRDCVPIIVAPGECQH